MYEKLYALNRRAFLKRMAWTTAAVALPTHVCKATERQTRPNIIFVMADDMGYGDPGCYGQKRIATPNIDRLAQEGICFTDCYAGAPICAPSRSVLMTGQHTGHTRVRGNMCPVGGSVGYKGSTKVRRMSLTPEDKTVGHVLREVGYHTGLVGKWHLGAYDPTAGPLDRGFDEFTGWLINEAQTGGYYPKQRVVNRKVVDVPARPDGSRPYSTDMCTDEAIEFIKKNGTGETSFFLYLAYNNPHSPLEVPDLGPYKDKDWPEHCKTYAAMIHRLDVNLGRLIQSLKDMGIDEETVVFFCSDNGPRSEPQAIQTEVAEFFDCNGPLRGYKRDLYDGGIRVPMIVRAPGRIRPGVTSDVPWYFADVMATVADLAGTHAAPNTDGTSIAPVLLGKQDDVGRRFLYWEYFESGFQQAVRWGQWKALRLKRDEPLELYDLSKDIGEQNNVAAQHPDVIREIETYLKTARTESENWPLSAVG
jgi:arylsulfatase A-like enzyme